MTLWLLGTMGKVPSRWMEAQEWGSSPTFIWDLSIGEDFIEQNPIGPDVGLEGVGAVVGCLWGCPLHWDFSAAAGGINVILESNGRQDMREGVINTDTAFGESGQQGMAPAWNSFMSSSGGREGPSPNGDGVSPELTLRSRASPKSAILQVSSSPTRMFLAARSRWTMCFSSRYLIPSATWQAMLSRWEVPRDFPSGPVNPENPSNGSNLPTSILGVLGWKETLCWQCETWGTCKTSNLCSSLSVLVVLCGKFSTAMCSSGMGQGWTLKSTEVTDIHDLFKAKGDLLPCKSHCRPLSLLYL